MWIAINTLKRVTIHQDEPSYNRLHDSWRTLSKVEAPDGTFKRFCDDIYTPMAIHIEAFTKEGSPLISKILKF